MNRKRSLRQIRSRGYTSRTAARPAGPVLPPISADDLASLRAEAPPAPWLLEPSAGRERTGSTSQAIRGPKRPIDRPEHHEDAGVIINMHQSPVLAIHCDRLAGRWAVRSAQAPRALGASSSAPLSRRGGVSSYCSLSRSRAPRARSRTAQWRPPGSKGQHHTTSDQPFRRSPW